MWISSHSVISGKEYADHLAKLEAYSSEVFNLFSSYELILYFKAVHKKFWSSFFVSFLSHNLFSISLFNLKFLYVRP